MTNDQTEKCWFNEESWVKDNRSEEEKWKEYIESATSFSERYSRSVKFYYWKQALARLPFAGVLKVNKDKIKTEIVKGTND